MSGWYLRYARHFEDRASLYRAVARAQRSPRTRSRAARVQRAWADLASCEIGLGFYPFEYVRRARYRNPSDRYWRSYVWAHREVHCTLCERGATRWLTVCAEHQACDNRLAARIREHLDNIDSGCGCHIGAHWIYCRAHRRVASDFVDL